MVSPGYLAERGFSIANEEVEKLSRQGKTTVLVLVKGVVRMAVALADITRPESKETVSELKKMGIKCLMITGDKKRGGGMGVHRVGIDSVLPRSYPQTKLKRLKKYRMMV